LQRDTAGILRRDAIFLAARFLGVLQRVLVPLLSQTDIDYGDQDTTPIMVRYRNSGPARPGRRVPLFAPPALDDGTPALDPYRLNIVCWPGRRAPADWAATVDTYRGRFSRQANVLDLAAVSGRAAAKLRRAFGNRPVVAVVRPDGHLAHRANADSPDEIATFLGGLLATTAPAVMATEELPV
jgi:hypothetical protein